MSGNDTQSLGAGFLFKYPFHVWKIELFPLVNIEYQRILVGKETVRNFGWIRFGGGLDFPVTGAFYARGEVMYAPGFFSSVRDEGNEFTLLSFLSETDVFRLNPASGFTMRFALGWRPGAAKPAKKKEKPAKTNREQTNQPQTSVNANANDISGQDNSNPDTARDVNYLSDLEKDIILEMNFPLPFFFVSISVCILLFIPCLETIGKT